MLETLCLESVQTSDMLRCIEGYFFCMAGATGLRPRNMAKARLFAFLAAQDISDPLVGRAAQKWIWPWENVAFKPLREFLSAL